MALDDPVEQASTASESRMSIGSASAAPPASRIAVTVSSSGSARRPQPTTVAPSAASSNEVARPRPVPAPETTHTWPSSSPGRKICEVEGDTELSLSAASAAPGPRRGPPSAGFAPLR